MSETASTFQKSCPQCGNMVDTDARFCKYCAFDLSKSSLDSDTTVVLDKSEQKNNPKPILLIVGIAVIGLFMLGLLGTYLYKKNRTQTEVVATSPTPTPAPTMSDRAKQVEEKILRDETLSDGDIAGLSAYELRVLRNVHFARYGRKYDQEGQLGGYFYTRSWYKPSDSYNENMITATDKANINLIVAAEKLLSNSEVANESNNSNTTVVTVSTPTPTPQSRTDLNRETVLSLASNMRKPVVVQFERGNQYGIHSQARNVPYERLINDKVITCKKNYLLRTGNSVDPSIYNYTDCVPGLKGREFSVSGGLFLQLTIGYKVPSQVTGISRIDANNAYADVLMIFEKAGGYSLYEKYSDIFGRPNIQNESRRVTLRLYDDGWRVEQFN